MLTVSPTDRRLASEAGGRPRPDRPFPVRIASDPAVDGIELSPHHLVLVPVAGRRPTSWAPVRYLVDFESVPAPTVGQVLHVRPGQAIGSVHGGDAGHGASLGPVGGAVGVMALAIDPDVAPPGLFAGHLPGRGAVIGSDAGVAALADDLASLAGDPAPDHRALLAGGGYLLHRLALARPLPGVGTVGGRLLADFLAAIEASLATDRPLDADRSVAELARRVGASPRTLGRTTAALLGCSPKEVVDQRVALQARRLLAASSLSAARIGWALGFSQPTNFTKFFVRTTGLSPLDFRAAW